jgi:hypothetical protein
MRCRVRERVSQHVAKVLRFRRGQVREGTVVGRESQQSSTLQLPGCLVEARPHCPPGARDVPIAKSATGLEIDHRDSLGWDPGCQLACSNGLPGLKPENRLRRHAALHLPAGKTVLAFGLQHVNVVPGREDRR